MFKLIFLLVIPLIELFVLIEVGSVIGGFTTILLIIATALLGIFFMRQQGTATIVKIKQNLADGKIPGKEILEGVFIFIGGVMLLLPGFITDTIGILFLIEPIRTLFARSFAKRQQRQYQQKNGNIYEAQWHESSNDNQDNIPFKPNLKADNDDIIDAEVIDSDNKPPK